MVAIDGTDLYLGRMASTVAKRLLNGEKVDIVNCEKIRISGNKKNIYDRSKRRLKLKSIVNPLRGAKYPKDPEKYVKRAVRGMLPYDRTKGRMAYRRLKVYYGSPENIKNVETIDQAKSNKIRKYTTVYNVCRELGGIKE